MVRDKSIQILKQGRGQNQANQSLAVFPDYMFPKVSSIDWAGWFNNPGMPPYKPKYDDSLAVACKALKDKWVSWDGQGDAPSPVSEWIGLTSAQKIEFLSLLLNEKEPLR